MTSVAFPASCALKNTLFQLIYHREHRRGVKGCRSHDYEEKKIKPKLDIKI